MCTFYMFTEIKIVKVCSNVGSIHVDIELKLNLKSCRICSGYLELGISCLLPERKKIRFP